jgi:hypothetical protein
MCPARLGSTPRVLGVVFASIRRLIHPANITASPVHILPTQHTMSSTSTKIDQLVATTATMAKELTALRSSVSGLEGAVAQLTKVNVGLQATVATLVVPPTAPSHCSRAGAHTTQAAASTSNPLHRGAAGAGTDASDVASDPINNHVALIAVPIVSSMHAAAAVQVPGEHKDAATHVDVGISTAAKQKAPCRSSVQVHAPQRARPNQSSSSNSNERLHALRNARADARPASAGMPLGGSVSKPRARAAPASVTV